MHDNPPYIAILVDDTRRLSVADIKKTKRCIFGLLKKKKTQHDSNSFYHVEPWSQMQTSYL